MIPEIFKIAGQVVLKEIINSSLKKVTPEIFKTKKTEFDRFKQDFPSLYESHFNLVCKWAFSIPFIGLSKPKDTQVSTIELLIASDILERSADSLIKVSELQILNSSDNILLVGAPGAGKTTTLKRLIISYISNVEGVNKYGFPILVRLRDMPAGLTIAKYIIGIFNIKYENRVSEQESLVRKIDEAGEIVYNTKITKTVDTYVGDVQIDRFLSDFLEETQALLLLDGLDEIEKSTQGKVLREIESLGMQLSKSKIILTVRKSEINKLLHNFTTYEIAALSVEQIEEIANKWLKTGSAFIVELNKKPYKDLANRPIFLTLLMVLYDKNNTLPMKPSEVYEEATYLIVKEWDEHRDIVRHSKYSDFNTRKKIKFIAEVSYLLTYKAKQKVFTSKMLESIYIEICDKYNLPADEMKMVVSEIESHTGMIVESKYRHFEFSHLSIQEFLCAQHLVNLPYSKETIEYFLEYPEPLAIAVSISGEPSLWLANLLLNSSLNINNFKDSKEAYFSSVYTLLNRLLVESPSFKVTLELGFTFFYLIANFYKNERFPALLDVLFEYPGVKGSLVMFLRGCTYQNTLKGFYLINKKQPSTTKYFITIPHIGEMPCSYFETLVEDKLLIVNKGIIL